MSEKLEDQPTVFIETFERECGRRIFGDLRDGWSDAMGKDIRLHCYGLALKAMEVRIQNGSCPNCRGAIAEVTGTDEGKGNDVAGSRRFWCSACNRAFWLRE